jgi:tetratricopeptide (TPR) repeat protein
MLPSGNLTTSISTKERSRLLNSSLILSNYGTFEPDEFGNFLVESIPAGIYNASIINPHCSKIIIPEIVIEPIKTTTLPCFYLSESNSNINKGWDELKSKNHERAYVFFQNVVETSSSILEIQEAYTGIAWTEFQRKNYSNAVIYFEKINEKSNDVKVILASIYLMNSSKVYIEKAYELLESVDNVYNYSCIVARNNIIIPVHKVISLKAICYFLVGEKEKLDLALKRLKTLPYDYRSYVTFTEFSQHIALIPHHQ